MATYEVSNLYCQNCGAENVTATPEVGTQFCEESCKVCGCKTLQKMPAQAK